MRRPNSARSAGSALDGTAVGSDVAGWVPPTPADTVARSTVSFEAFFRDVRPNLLAFLSVPYGPHVAEELAQEALARAHLHWQTVRELRRPQAWVFRVAMNLGASWRRRRAAERRALERVGRHDHPAPPPDHDDALAVRGAVMALPRRARTVLLLRYFADLSIAETAAVLRCSTGTVKSDTHDAVAALRRGGLLAREGSTGGT